jgi:hypothetical protein
MVTYNDILRRPSLGATPSPPRERTTIGETMLSTTKVPLRTFQTFPRRQRSPTNVILFRNLSLVANTTPSILSSYPRRVNPTTPRPPPLRLFLLYAPLPRSHLDPLASLPDAVRTLVTILLARHLPKLWLSLAVTGSCRLGIVAR